MGPLDQRCAHCGEEVEAHHRFCSSCGEPLPAAGPAAKRKDSADAAAVERSIASYLKAVSTFERMLHGGARDATRSQLTKGDGLVALGEYELAVQAYREALERDPINLEAKLALAKLFNRLTRYREAIALCDEIIDLHPTNDEVYLVKARALLATGDFSGIIDLHARSKEWGIVSTALARVADLAKRRYREVLVSSAVVQEVFVIHTTSLLLAHRSRLFRPHVDSDLVAGTLRAIQDFIQVALTGGEGVSGRLNEMHYGSFTVMVESRDLFQIAFVVSGTPDKGMRESFVVTADEIEQRFGDVLVSWDGSVDVVRGVQEFLDKEFFPELSAEEIQMRPTGP